MKIADNIKKLMEIKGWSQQKLAEKVGSNQPSITRYAKGDFTPKPHMIEKLATLAGVTPATFQYGDISQPSVSRQGIPILGNVQAGTWTEVDLLNQGEQETLPFSHDPRYPNMKHFAVKAVGDSMNKVADDGAILICLSVPDNGLTPQEGDLVIAEQLRSGDLREVTVKRLCKEGGDIILRPESTNPAHLPIKMNGGVNTQVSIIGLVIASYNEV